MSLKMFLNITRIQGLPKSHQKALHVGDKAQESEQIRSHDGPRNSAEQVTKQTEKKGETYLETLKKSYSTRAL